MEEDKHPSLPSNYVSLVQLQERWVKEQQRKQREKEELERKQVKDQKKQRPKQNGDKGLDNSSSSSRRPFRRDNHSRGVRDGQTVEVNKPNLKESKIERFESECEPKKAELNERVEEKKKKCRKPGVEENLAVGSSRLPPVEKLQVLATERNVENEEIESKFRENSVDQVENHKIWKPRVQINRAAALARDAEELSLNDRKGCRKTNMGRREYSRGSERADLCWKQRDCNRVWVKKGERTGTGTQNSELKFVSPGTSVNAGKDKHRRQQQKPRYNNTSRY